jgi:hypothetical protein
MSSITQYELIYFGVLLVLEVLVVYVCVWWVKTHTLHIPSLPDWLSLYLLSLDEIISLPPSESYSLSMKETLGFRYRITEISEYGPVKGFCCGTLSQLHEMVSVWDAIGTSGNISIKKCSIDCPKRALCLRSSGVLQDDMSGVYRPIIES